MKPTNEFEKTLNELLSEESKGSRLEIPQSIYRKVLEFQSLYRRIYDIKITREKAILLMIVEGIDSLEQKITQIERAVEALEG